MPGLPPQTDWLLPPALAQASSADAERLMAEGIDLANQGNFQEAVALWQRALAIYQRWHDRENQAIAWVNLGNGYFSLGQYPNATDAFEQALAIAQSISDGQNQVSALIGLGNLQDAQGFYRRAIDYYERALAIAQRHHDIEGQMMALGNLGIAYGSLNDPRALDFFQQALSLAQENDDWRRQASAWNGIGTYHFGRGAYQQAISPFQQALGIYQQLQDAYGQSLILSNLGGVHKGLGEYPQAIEYTRQALRLSEHIGDAVGIKAAYNNLGILHNVLGLYPQAIEFLTQALPWTEQLNDPAGRAIALTNLGIASLHQGELTAARQYHEQALALYRQIESPRGEAMALSNVGLVHSETGAYEQAITHFETGLAMFREIGDRQGEANVWGNLGIVYQQLGRYAESIAALQQQHAIAKAIGDRVGESNALANWGHTLLLWQKYSEAEARLRQSIGIRAAIRGDLSDRERVALFDRHHSPYENLQVALVAQHKTDAALEIAEQGRAEAFALLLATRFTTRPLAAQTQPPNLVAIQTLAQQQQATLIEYSIVLTFEGTPWLYAWVVSPEGRIVFRQQPLTGIDLTSLLAESRDAMGVRGDRTSATITVEYTPESLAQRRAKADETLSQLYDLLIAPIADLLPTDPEQPVVFMPQGELFLVPFPALRAPRGDYLIEHHTILTAPSLQVLQLAHNLAQARDFSSVLAATPLVVGNPTMPTVTLLNDGGIFAAVQLRPLAGAQREAEVIAEFLQAPVLLGDQATESAVKQQLVSAELIHLATHGLLEYGDPRETGTRDTPGAIALAPGGGEDGLLTAAEILQMDLPAELAVLSACDTGRGRITGDGVIGLSRAFMAAGVPSIVVSLWAVPDVPTAQLMTAFYRHIAQGQTKAQALRQAMLATMQATPDPVDWAAFTLIGAAE
ncbi:tetratricopeptide repeat domain protein [Halomicronema hongdechloris C2206]|uniref:Tetratricopeptide repeat domain protein n=1 Tax=Halomicronema hongdechloris C2206 TaxID=1641165 RepID=A0A1Z3HPX6_9CYAN|nr:CHAT domain-containing tetratricopeptide repeat protein [Halomicronema hongdechloris]ASC72306.1 tetratricopeptide repeat domain protein [Halomicronema hongdechloris C2206]